MSHAGELAALGTAVCWGTSALAFEAAGGRIGSMVVNFLRLVLGLGFLTAYTSVFRGMPLPTDASLHAWSWLAVSGVVGFTFGDLCLFRAFVIIGPRLSTLLMSLAPPMTAVIAWAFLGETLSATELLGMTLTVAGVAWAIFDRTGDQRDRHVGRPLVGVALGACGALGQAGGLVLSKYGMGSYDAFAATQIRIIAGIAAFALLFTALRWWPRVAAGLSDRRATGQTALGAVFGPFLGVALSLIAVKHTEAGIAASIMATTPILIIPAVVLLKRERVGLGGIAGATTAVFGVALLFT